MRAPSGECDRCLSTTQSTVLTRLVHVLLHVVSYVYVNVSLVHVDTYRRSRYMYNFETVSASSEVGLARRLGSEVSKHIL